jgi:pilus assembly protein CpaB
VGVDASGSKWRRWWRPDVLLVLGSVAMGVGGATLAARYLEQRASAAEAKLAQRYAGREVIVAAADVMQGTALTRGNLAVRSMPAEFLPPDALPADRAGGLLGATASVDIARGTPIVPALLSAGTALPRLSAVLAADERAVTVAVDDLNSQAGGLRAGDRVDLHYTQRANGAVLLVPLLQQVEILAVGDSFIAGEDSPPRSFATVTLRVAADDAPRVLLAQQAGDLSVLLRSPEDAAAKPTLVRSSSELLRQPVTRRGAAQIELLIGGEGEQVPLQRMISAGAARVAEAS